MLLQVHSFLMFSCLEEREREVAAVFVALSSHENDMFNYQLLVRKKLRVTFIAGFPALRGELSSLKGHLMISFVKLLFNSETSGVINVLKLK